MLSPVRSSVQVLVLLRSGFVCSCILAISLQAGCRPVLRSSIHQGETREPVLSAVVVSPSQAILPPGGTSQFTVVGQFSDGSIRDIASLWSATGGTIGPSGAYTAGTTPGTFRVFAMSATGVHVDTSIVVVRATPAAVVLLPATVILAPGQTQQFSATGVTTDGATATVSVTYTATGGTISSGGLYTAGAISGIFRVIATQSGGTRADTAQVTIEMTVGTDRIVLNGDVAAPTGGPAWPTVVLVDAMVLPLGHAPGDLGSCQNDLVRGSDLTFADLRESSLCGFRDEVAVFSTDNAALLDMPEADAGMWKNGAGEVRTESLVAPLAIPLKVWVAVGPNVTTDGIKADGTIGKVVQDALDVVGDDIATLSTLSNLSRVGLVPLAVMVQVWSVPAAVTAIGKTCSATLKASSWYSPDALNVYYVAQAEKPTGGTYAGWYCGSLETLESVRDPHMIFISFSQRNFTVLSHEVGHALGLLHTGSGTSAATFDQASSTPNPFANDNIMWDAASAPRSSFALGQAFRMNFDVRSILFSLALRSPPGRPCECTLMSVSCPIVEFYRQSDLVGRACPRISLTVP
jgi:hypothetical protein